MRFIHATALALLAATSAAAQTIPSEPITFGEGRVVLSGDASVSVSPKDEGFFNYSDYEQTTLRQFSVGMAGLFRLSERLSLLGELRSDNLEYVTALALYARIRPIPDKQLDIQIGRIPPTFGSFSRRGYGHDNPLIGIPLAYQYLTMLPQIAQGDANKVWVIPSEFTGAMEQLANAFNGEGKSSRGEVKPPPPPPSPPR